MSKKRIVLKIGSSSLTNTKGEIDEQKFMDHIMAIVALRKMGHEVVLVSSGAVAAGFRALGYPGRPVTLKGKQAAAAVGQSLLIQNYMQKLGKFNLTPAQILLTRNDFSMKDRYKNAYSTMEELLSRGIIPIINENDTVSVAELTFGDNDMLSALVSGLIHAEQLIILTDINGVYDSNPGKNKDAKRFDFIHEVTDSFLSFAEGSGTKVGTGGMLSKLLAARTANSLGVPVFIGSGQGENKLLDIIAGHGNGTYVGKDSLSPLKNTKQWIAFHSAVTGRIYVDEGAELALLKKGSSLLPAGIQHVAGTFEKGDVVEVHGNSGLLGKGEVLYPSYILERMMGKHSTELACGTNMSMEIIHRDQWVTIPKERKIINE
ncbi:hypothetical protein AC622_09280 [Bacillus sp. FJAT-27916]|uniref:glutamate 5-kinase n=1 Tax=Bacillus sp. FJAT-27916 TaxID=1679169 RepID=UPI00067131DC|nr:glutamate 5-kinase [Bacillus sp. FJAT-27916]KMY44417.1 hypothetical protein AC622_09280 [Bacillus sp. FJAT-27916]